MRSEAELRLCLKDISEVMRIDYSELKNNLDVRVSNILRASPEKAYNMSEVINKAYLGVLNYIHDKYFFEERSDGWKWFK